jgi:four helix bundle protein
LPHPIALPDRPRPHVSAFQFSQFQLFLPSDFSISAFQRFPAPLSEFQLFLLLLLALSFLLSAFQPFSFFSFMRLPPEFRDRAKRFASSTIKLFVALPKSREEVRVLGKQMLRAGTSVAAHVREASRARSSAEFASKIGGALQEADETILWLELLREDCGIKPEWTTPIETEGNELIAIMATMTRNTKS